MVGPDDPDRDEADDVGRVARPAVQELRAERLLLVDGDVENQQGGGEGEDAVRKRLEPVLGHRSLIQPQGFRRALVRRVCRIRPKPRSRPSPPPLLRGPKLQPTRRAPSLHARWAPGGPCFTAPPAGSSRSPATALAGSGTRTGW